MGVDFLSKATKSFQKSWDRGRELLDTPVLFDKEPEMRERCYTAIPSPGSRFNEKAVLVVRVSGSDLQVFDGVSCIGRFLAPPKTLIDEVLGNGRGVAVATVQRVAEASGIADISVQ
ncbi:MAG TPA: hypothetical protein VFB96_18740 [Pirellulaceae bacterium]|nr:hypothetical protein [Pirellulaceae bacterium]